MCGNRRYLCSAADFPDKWANQPTNQRSNERQLCAPGPLSKDTQVLNSPKPPSPSLNNRRNCNLSNPYIDRVCTESQRISVNANAFKL